MTLVDDAKRLAGRFDPHYKHHDGVSRCYFCRAEIAEPKHHQSDCPWLAMPQIVAALEAAAVFVSVNGKDSTSMVALMRAEDNLHAAFGDKRRYQDGSQS